MTKKKGIWLWAILAVVLLLLPVLVAAAAAQEIPTPGGCENPSPSIAISASRTEIPADGVSTAEIKVVVSWPEEIGGGLAMNTSVDMSTTLGRLTDAENQSNNGSSISLITDTNGIVTALLSGNETGVAYVTLTLLETCNKTTVTFVAPEATPTSPPSGDGDGGNGGAVTTPTPTPTATATVTPGETATPSPTPGATATPSVSPGASPVTTASPEPTSSPDGGIPGFEAVFAIAGLLAVAYLVLQRRKA